MWIETLYDTKNAHMMPLEKNNKTIQLSLCAFLGCDYFRRKTCQIPLKRQLVSFPTKCVIFFLLKTRGRGIPNISRADNLEH